MARFTGLQRACPGLIGHARAEISPVVHVAMGRRQPRERRGVKRGQNSSMPTIAADEDKEFRRWLRLVRECDLAPRAINRRRARSRELAAIYPRSCSTQTPPQRQREARARKPRGTSPRHPRHSEPRSTLPPRRSAIRRAPIDAALEHVVLLLNTITSATPWPPLLGTVWPIAFSWRWCRRRSRSAPPTADPAATGGGCGRRPRLPARSCRSRRR